MIMFLQAHLMMVEFSFGISESLLREVRITSAFSVKTENFSLIRKELRVFQFSLKCLFTWSGQYFSPVASETWNL